MDSGKTRNSLPKLTIHSVNAGPKTLTGGLGELTRDNSNSTNNRSTNQINGVKKAAVLRLSMLSSYL
jgi:hypothetical protein